MPNIGVCRVRLRARRGKRHHDHHRRLTARGVCIGGSEVCILKHYERPLATDEDGLGDPKVPNEAVRRDGLVRIC